MWLNTGWTETRLWRLPWETSFAPKSKLKGEKGGSPNTPASGGNTSPPRAMEFERTSNRYGRPLRVGTIGFLTGRAATDDYLCNNI